MPPAAMPAELALDSKAIRCFVAIALPQSLKLEMRPKLAGLRQGYPQLAWVPAENLHVTVEFLGDRRPEQTAAIARLLADFNVGRLGVTLEQVSCLPRGGRPRVLVWDATPADRLVALRARLVEALGPSLGPGAGSGTYRPHSTLARASAQATSELFQLASTEASRVAGTAHFEVSRLTLFESLARPGRPPAYRPIEASPEA